MRKATAILLLCSVVIAAGIACDKARSAAKSATDAKTALCDWLSWQDPAKDERFARAQEGCAKDQDVRELLAILAGDKCVQPPIPEPVSTE